MGAIFANGDLAAVRYEGDGESREFPFEFAVFAGSDIKVTVNGDEISENVGIALNTSQSSGETGDGIVAASGGTVTFATAPVTGADVLIARRLGLRRLSHYDSGSSLRADVLNADFDYVLAALGDVEAGFAGTLPMPDGAINARGGRASAPFP